VVSYDKKVDEMIARAKKKNASYTSPMIQKEILHISFNHNEEGNS
jgi:hypothetical protein